jgi:hypothetical protein
MKVSLIFPGFGEATELPSRAVSCIPVSLTQSGRGEYPFEVAARLEKARSTFVPNDRSAVNLLVGTLSGNSQGILSTFGVTSALPRWTE